MHENGTVEQQHEQNLKHRLSVRRNELYAALRERKEREKRERNNRETVHSLIRRHYAGIVKTLENSDIRETFLATGFSPAQFRKAALYGMVYAARKYKPESGKEETKYLCFYAGQEIRKQCRFYSCCFYVNQKTGKTFCSIPAFDRDFRRSGHILFQRRGRKTDTQ